jgi:hypothetical protein
MSTNVICSGEHILVYPLFSRDAFYNYPQTAAIAWRIFLVGKPLGGSTSLWLIIFVIIESSALYAVGVIAALVSFLSNTNGQYAAVDAIVPLVVSYALHLVTFPTQILTHAQGIVFSLIVLQIHFHISVGKSIQMRPARLRGRERVGTRPTRLQMDSPAAK